MFMHSNSISFYLAKEMRGKLLFSPPIAVRKKIQVRVHLATFEPLLKYSQIVFSIMRTIPGGPGPFYDAFSIETIPRLYLSHQIRHTDHSPGAGKQHKRRKLRRMQSTTQLPFARRRVGDSSEFLRLNSSESGSELEASLAQLMQQHQLVSLVSREHAEKSKKEAIRKGIRVSELLVDAVNGRVQDSFIHEKQIEFEIRSLSSSILRFSKLTHHWLAASHAINTALKEIGDFDNWVRTMEFDCRTINAALHNIHRH